MCLHQELMKRVVVEPHDGWDFVNEGTERKPKKGYVSNQTGSVLMFDINTWRGGDNHDGRVKVMVAHLVSYDLVMGQARVACASNCVCEEKTVDGLDESKKESQTYLTILNATQHLNCILSVTNVGRGDGKAGTKFKVSGIMMAELAGEMEVYRE